MCQDQYSFNFSRGIPHKDVEGTFMLALLAVESLHGKEAVRMDCRFKTDFPQRRCLIGAGSQIGCELARIFAGLVTHAFGREEVRIRRRNLCCLSIRRDTDRDFAEVLQ